MSTIQKQYFPAVDGLRTIAVMLVVIFHADKHLLPGGFIGVDVFFVISGFLITRNIVFEIQRGSWSFSNFYVRRVARLFPALYATLLATLVAGFFILNPIDLERLGHVSIFTVLSVSNVFFWMESGYFDVSTSVKPFLHTWSLAVEEQFYLVWPLLIFGFYNLRKLKAVIIGLSLLGAISLAMALVVQSYNPAAVFYLTPFRAYQFALGGIVGLLGLCQRPTIATIFFLTGLAGSFALGYLVDGRSGHFVAATLPAAAAAAIIYGSNAKIPSLLLGNAAMVWLGKRSYSIYLVHWPMMVLWKLKASSSFGVTEVTISIILSVVIGAVLHRIVEMPNRFQKHFTLRRKNVIITGIVFAAVATLVSGAHYWAKDGYPTRVVSEVAKIAQVGDGPQLRFDALRNGSCNLMPEKKASDYDEVMCARVDPNKPSYMIVGDSFASNAYLVMKEAYPEIHFLQMTLPGCHLRLPKRFRGNEAPACKELYGKALNEYARQPGVKGIVLASNWESGHYYRIDDILNLLADTDLRIYIVGQQIRFEQELPAIVIVSSSAAQARVNAQNQLEPEPSDINELMRERFGKSSTFVDFMALQCPSDCDVIDDKFGLYYMDDSHLSVAGSKALARRLAESRPDLFR